MTSIQSFLALLGHPTNLVLALAFLFALAYKLLGTTTKKNGFSLPPGPKPWPVVGNLPEMVRNKPTFRWIHGLMEEMNTEIACFKFGGVHVIPVTSPEIACEFLKENDAIFSSRPRIMAADLTSNHYKSAALSPLGDQWKKMKKIISTQIVSPARLRWLHDTRTEEADHLMHYLYNQCKDSLSGGIVNVRTASRHYCGNVIRKMIFGKRFFGKGAVGGGPGVEEEEHVEGLFTVLAYLYKFCVSDYMPWLRRFDLDGHESIVRGGLGLVRKYHDHEVDERIQMWKDGIRKKEEDILDILIRLKESDGTPILTASEIKSQIIELMIASVDNPSNAVEWVLAEMLNQPEILQRAVEEVDSVVGRDRLVQESDIPKLNYVKACVREAFRLHPGDPFNVPHVSTEDAVVAGYFIPKGSHVLLSRPALGRNASAWEEPLKYKPERHLRSDGSDVFLTDSDLRILSFSTGKRACAGIMLGSLMTVMLMARLLQGFTWSLPPGVSSIDLTEAKHFLTMANPLAAQAKPRLAQNFYAAV